jgi:hypothetical protein
MLGTLIFCLLLAWLVGRAMHIGSDLRTLIGVGTAICGASAIAAVTPTIRAKNPDTTYAISTIFLLNVLAVLVFPPIGHALGLSQEAFGLFAGTAVNDTSSVVAAAASYGPAAADHAVVVKLVRTLMIIPVVIGLSILVRRRDRMVRRSQAVRSGAVVPHRLRPRRCRELGRPGPGGQPGAHPAGGRLPHRDGTGGDRAVHRRRHAAPYRTAADGAGAGALGRGDVEQLDTHLADRVTR